MGILIHYLRIRKIRNDYEQERKMSRMVRVSDFVRHAQAQGLARRIQSAAELRTPATALWPNVEKVQSTKREINIISSDVKGSIVDEGKG